MDFVDCLFVFNANDIVVDDDLEEPNNSCGDDIPFENISNVEGGLFNSLVEKNYLHPCAYGNNVDEKLHFDVEGDDDEKINHCFKDLNLHDLENLKAGGRQHNIHPRIWAINAFDTW
jgi:hypothetical protein